MAIPAGDVIGILAEHLLAGITPERTLASLWVSNIEDDLAGQEIAAFRESLRQIESAMRLTAIAV